MPIPIDDRTPGTAKPLASDGAARPASSAGVVVVGGLVGGLVGPVLGGVAGIRLDAVIGTSVVFALVQAGLGLLWEPLVGLVVGLILATPGDGDQSPDTARSEPASEQRPSPRK